MLPCVRTTHSQTCYQALVVTILLKAVEDAVDTLILKTGQTRNQALFCSLLKAVEDAADTIILKTDRK